MVSRIHLLAFALFVAALLVISGCNVSQQSAPTQAALVPTATPNITCEQLVSQAESSVGQICDGLERNKACYGNHLISVDFQPNVSATFNTSGDIVDLLDIKSLSTSPINLQTHDWGIAVIKAQANLPGSLPGENVTFLLYGDTTVNNPSPDMHAVTVSTRIGTTNCTSVPDSAVLIQSPEGAQVAMNINGADVTLSSTAYVTAEQNQNFTFAVVEGMGTISSQGVTRSVPPGAEVQIPLGGADGLQASGAPSQVMPFDQQAVQLAPLSLLDRPVTVPQPIPAGQTIPAATDTATPQPNTQPTATACAPRADWTDQYVVQRGDSLSDIALRINVSAADLQAGNCIANPNQLIAGQTLLVPRPVPTDTALPPSATPTPITSPTQAGPNLRADQNPINAGDCTTVRWDVNNAKAIFFAGQPTTGHGSQQVCPQSTTTYTLLVQTQDNQRQPYQITITVQSSKP